MISAFQNSKHHTNTIQYAAIGTGGGSGGDGITNRDDDDGADAAKE